MALIPTHLRFALDVAGYHSNPELKPYLSGTIYPDSRWTTGIDRTLTHHSRFLDPAFPADNFTLGWHIHCVCDSLQNEIHAPLLEHLIDVQSGNSWILQSVAKVIQDMNDLQQFDLKSAFRTADLIQNPNGENQETVEAFYEIISGTYENGNPPTPFEYGVMWRKVGLDEETTGKLLENLNHLLIDDVFVGNIENSYNAVLDLYIERYIQNNKD